MEGKSTDTLKKHSHTRNIVCTRTHAHTLSLLCRKLTVNVVNIKEPLVF